LKAGVNKVWSHDGNIAADKIISTVSKKFSKPPKEVVKTIVYKEVESDEESFRPLVNIIMKELSQNNSLTSPDKLNATAKNNTMVMKQQITNFKVN